MADNIRLTTELNEVRRRCETDRMKYEMNQRQLEEQIEELRTKLTAADDSRRSAADDYQRRIDTLEKQIKSNKEFLEVSVRWSIFETIIPSERSAELSADRGLYIIRWKSAKCHSLIDSCLNLAHMNECCRRISFQTYFIVRLKRDIRNLFISRYNMTRMAHLTYFFMRVDSD